MFERALLASKRILVTGGGRAPLPCHRRWRSALLAMAKSLAVEWGPKGIRTVAIAPGAFPTPGASGQLRPEGRHESRASKNPLGRAGEHGGLADLASFLISDRAGYIQWAMGVQFGGAGL